MYNRRRQENYGVLLLVMQLLSFGYQNIPPVTLGTILLNVAIYLRLLNVPTISNVCISASHVISNRDVKRLILASLFHADDMHLYYNMISFLWKGKTLETILGSVYFAYLLTVFSLLTSATYVVLSHLLRLITGNFSFDHTCAVGFSGGIFINRILAELKTYKIVFRYPNLSHGILLIYLVPACCPVVKFRSKSGLQL
ncbi:rhomboid-related protein 4-like isoform X2 [Gordionus sp. m RMFG-2023]|uniref:rhomboid-related protein 4-like isoform X2 n=1 Tax=Gordionus sp. m RMFG-2023 TaxID=3053472 RepID=UPI0031FC55E3